MEHVVQALIEIPLGSKNKYEMDKETLQNVEPWAQGRSWERTVVPFHGLQGPSDRWPGKGGGVIGVGWHVQTCLTMRNWVGREAEKLVGTERPWGPLLRWAP